MDQDTDRRNDMTLLTPLLAMALIIVCGLLFFGIAPSSVPEQHASATPSAPQQQTQQPQQQPSPQTANPSAAPQH